MDTLADIFNDDAFSAVNLTAAINKIDRVPGHAGRFAFAGDGNDDAGYAEDAEPNPDAVEVGIRTNAVGIEYKNEAITLIASKPRGAPSEKEGRDKAKLIAIEVPHIPLQDTIHADEVQGVREFGTDEPKSVESLVTKQLEKISQRHDLTLEHLRLGAVKGVIRDADGSVLVNVFEEFGILNSDGQYAPETVDFDLDNWTQGPDTIRVRCQQVLRFMQRSAKDSRAQNAKAIAFCGDGFFDRLLEHPTVRGIYDGTGAAMERLGDDYVNDAFTIGDVTFINYVGTDDNSTVAVASDEARFFLTGVPGLFRQFDAPANFIETVNTPGLPRYAKIANDQRFNQYVEIHTEQNPLPLCLRPKTLVRGVVSST